MHRITHARTLAFICVQVTVSDVLEALPTMQYLPCHDEDLEAYKVRDAGVCQLWSVCSCRLPPVVMSAWTLLLATTVLFITLKDDTLPCVNSSWTLKLVEDKTNALTPPVLTFGQLGQCSDPV